MPLTLEIVTPESRVYSDTIDHVVIPTVEGEIGILPGHIPLLTQMADGELRVTKSGQTEFLALGGGFACRSARTLGLLRRDDLVAQGRRHHIQTRPRDSSPHPGHHDIDPGLRSAG